MAVGVILVMESQTLERPSVCCEKVARQEMITRQQLLGAGVRRFNLQLEPTASFDVLT